MISAVESKGTFTCLHFFSHVQTHTLLIVACSYLTVTLCECMCSWPSHTPFTAHLSMSDRPLLSSSLYSVTFFSLSFMLTFGKSLVSLDQHEQWAVGISCNQDGSWLIAPLEHVCRAVCRRNAWTQSDGVWLLRLKSEAAPDFWQTWRWTAGAEWQKQSTESDGW